MTGNYHRHQDGDISTYAAKNSACGVFTQFDDRAWVEKALNFWVGTTSKKCGKSRKIIDWNIEQLTAAMKRLDAPKSTLTSEFDGWLTDHGF